MRGFGWVSNVLPTAHALELLRRLDPAAFVVSTPGRFSIILPMTAGPSARLPYEIADVCMQSFS